MAEEAHHEHMREVLTEMVDDTPQLHEPKIDEDENTNKVDNLDGVESEDRGLFGLFGKKEEKKHENEVIPQTDPKVEEGYKHETLVEKQSSHSDSSSSDEEEVEEGVVKKKKTKGLPEKIDENISGNHVDNQEDVSFVPTTNYEAHAKPTIEQDEKIGFLDKAKDKLPGHKSDDMIPPLSSPAPVDECDTTDGEAKEKKGILEKIKDKISGHHSKDEEKKESEKNSATH